MKEKMSPSGHYHNGTAQIHCQEYLFLGEKILNGK